MASYLLDSNHASPLVTIGHPLRHKIFGHIANGDTFALCVPVVVETKFGISILPRAKSNIEEWQRVLTQLTVYPLDKDDANAAVELQLSLRKNGWQLASFDALIAIIALRYDLTLLTTDKDFSAVDGLQTENWLLDLE